MIQFSPFSSTAKITFGIDFSNVPFSLFSLWFTISRCWWGIKIDYTRDEIAQTCFRCVILILFFFSFTFYTKKQVKIKSKIAQMKTKFFALKTISNFLYPRKIKIASAEKFIRCQQSSLDSLLKLIGDKKNLLIFWHFFDFFRLRFWKNFRFKIFFSQYFHWSRWSICGDS